MHRGAGQYEHHGTTGNTISSAPMHGLSIMTDKDPDQSDGKSQDRILPCLPCLKPLVMLAAVWWIRDGSERGLFKLQLA